MLCSKRPPSFQEETYSFHNTLSLLLVVVLAGQQTAEAAVGARAVVTKDRGLVVGVR